MIYDHFSLVICVFYLPERNDGVILLKTPPEIRPKTSVAMLLALPNLSHLVKAKALVIVNAIAIITKINDKNSNFKTASTARAIQNAGAT